MSDIELLKQSRRINNALAASARRAEFAETFPGDMAQLEAPDDTAPREVWGWIVAALLVGISIGAGVFQIINHTGAIK
jgi:hypothetical protein